MSELLHVKNNISKPAEMKPGRSHIILFSVITIGGILFTFIFIKAYISSFTHDESFSYLNYCNESFMEIISYSNWYTNNHILNSLFMKYSEKLFGSSEIALRLPNLLLLIVYMVYSYLLFKDTNSFLTVAMFTLMCTNCALMDLFGLARGYGMSCGFMLMSLYHFIRYFKDPGITNLALFHAGSLMACLSNFTMLTYYVAIMIVYNLVVLMNSKFVNGVKFRFFKSNMVHIVPLTIVIIVLFEPVRRVITYNTLNFGGSKGFYADTIIHLIYNVFHGISLPSFVISILQIIFTSLVLISLFIVILMMVKRNKSFFEEHTGLITSCFLLILISVIIIALHVFFKADYPISRFSIFLFPVFMVHIGFLVHYLMSLKYEKLILAVISIIALASMINFWQNTSLRSSIEWAYDTNTKDMIQTLMSHREKNNPGTGNVRLGINRLFEPTINFYRETMGIEWLQPVDDKGISKNDDYCYMFNDELNQLDSSEYEVIKKYSNINTMLIMNIKVPDK